MDSENSRARTFQENRWNVVATMRSPEKETELNQLDNVLVTELDVVAEIGGRIPTLAHHPGQSGTLWPSVHDPHHTGQRGRDWAQWRVELGRGSGAARLLQPISQPSNTPIESGLMATVFSHSEGSNRTLSRRRGGGGGRSP